ncbi:hypothetical protein LZ24_02381 [Desulfobotulus alkaliphilus]|uniref:PilZ domain-containing protein n=1 Tax=Desulfobotulus alkaliphilus TaxID=622671 RepID=A0A562RIK0_9BACT|nr:PilZ domain-containing protein [Desulfobotulus alkaliphilus]TWI68907.1 hypothetical protein LZ24_02381 [Desulfobotulus alkaliphilus]
MTDSPEKLFSPGRGIDVVFNLNSLSPLVRASIIYDATHKKNELIIAQTTPRILPNTSFDEMHVTILVMGEKREKKRLGLKCKISGIRRDYALSKDTKEEAVFIEYMGKISEVNIRSAFRMSPGKNYSIFAKMILKDREYTFGKDFSILDLSITGIGIVVPKKNADRANPLLKTETGTTFTLGMALKHSEDEKVIIEKVACIASIARINNHFNENAALVGLQFLKMKPESEEILSRFIHHAQLDQIRQLNRYQN